MKTSTGFFIILTEYIKRLSANVIISLMVIISVFTGKFTVSTSKNVDMTISKGGISLNSTNSDATSKKGNNTFSKKGITFNYPLKWTEFPNFINQIISGDLHEIGVLDGPNSDAHLVVQKYSLSYLGAKSFQEYQKKDIEYLKQSKASIIMENNTADNDLTVYEAITYDYNPDNTTQKTLFVTAGKGRNVYILQFYSSPELFDRYLPEFRQIISTIKLQ